MKKIIIVSGYFNPIHVGHLEYIRLAKEYNNFSIGDILCVIVNNDNQVEMKGSNKFYDVYDRIELCKSTFNTEYVVISIDYDLSVLKTIKNIKQNYGSDYELIFCKGGDRNSTNCPEYQYCIDNGIKFVDGLGEKIRSSSEFLV